MPEQDSKTTACLDAPQLALELNAFCRQMFHFLPDDDLVRRYQKANAVVFSQTRDSEYRNQNHRLTAALRGKRDLEALEYAWRFLDRENILTRKFHVFMFLIETDPKFYPCFVNHKKKRVAAYFILSWLSIRSAWKLFKGIWNILTLKEGRT